MGLQAWLRELEPSGPPGMPLGTGGWRDYVTLLHLPYTAWHLSYVVIGGCLAPAVSWSRLGATVAAFALAVGIGAHALDELRGRPLRTSIPDRVLISLAAASIAAACSIGVAGAIAFEACLVLLVPVGLFLVLAYNLELLAGASTPIRRVASIAVELGGDPRRRRR